MHKNQEKKTIVKKKKATSSKKKKVAKKKTEIEIVLDTDEQENLADVTADIGGSEYEIEDITDVSEERSSIISIVRGLEGQVETAFKLKEVLESELESTQLKLADEMEARTQLEIDLEALQAQASTANQLRQDISFAEDERNTFADNLGQNRKELRKITAERDSILEQLTESEVNVKRLESEKLALGAQVMNLKDNITDTDHLRDELAEITRSDRQSRELVHELTRRAETAEISKNALEMQLSETHQNIQNLRIETEQLRRKVADDDSKTVDMRIQLEDQQATNRELIESNTRLENEIKMANINYAAAKNELDSFKGALRDIRSEASRTSGRVRQRYFKLNSYKPSVKPKSPLR